MKTIYQNQNNFIETLGYFEQWYEKFNYLIELGELLPTVCPEELLSHRVFACQSMTFFCAWVESGWLRANGWSNAPVQRGLIVSIIEMFDRTPIHELTDVGDIYFHDHSDLINQLTPLRREGLKEIIRRIIVLCSPKENV